MIYAITGFIICAALIFFTGRNLSKYGDIIADHLGLGKAWIGLILMASVTSLPELVVGISSVTIVGSADLAAGDVLGSCVFNLMILSVLDVFVKGKPLFTKTSTTHVMAGSMGIILVAMAGLGIFLPNDIIITPWIGLTSFAFIIVYFLAIKVIYSFERSNMPETEITDTGHKLNLISLKKATLLYTLNALGVIGAALFLPGFAETIAKETGLGESFVGTLFLAASTSFPEMAVSFSALRMGSFDMAVGNLLGSNIFNILILAIDDIFYTKGQLLKDASDSNIVSVFAVIIMTSIAIAGLSFQKRGKKRFLLALDSLLILLVYIVNLLILYQMTS
jgi:cation:H+ antiporter